MSGSKGFKFFISALAIVVVSAFAGTVSGTVAWFAYSTRATATYSGASVSEGELIQAGLVCERDYWAGATAEETADNHHEMEINYGLTYEYVDGKHIYFTDPGTGIRASAVKAYLAQTGYAIDRLEPVTSRYYTTNIADENVGNDLTLYKAPSHTYVLNTHTAEHTQYTKIKLAFRILDSGGSSIYKQGQSIWISGVSSKASGAGNIVEALRVFIDGSASSGKRYILNPNKTTDGRTAVAGLLNLSGDDDYYDTDHGEEIVYGDYDGSLVTTHIVSDSDFEDINGTGNTSSEATTFYAKHEKNMDVYDYSYSDFIAGIRPRYAEYKGVNDIYPIDDRGSLSGGIPACVTATDEDNSKRNAYLDLTIWLEGWDHVVIDEEIDHAFNLNLKFQINRN
ncbi:MAG: hypothetical protein IJQ67_00125 [Bacilli bacterium]|nr:hypothetical protein [Bacilli bacterium]